MNAWLLGAALPSRSSPRCCLARFFQPLNVFSNVINSRNQPKSHITPQPPPKHAASQGVSSSSTNYPNSPHSARREKPPASTPAQPKAASDSGLGGERVDVSGVPSGYAAAGVSHEVLNRALPYVDDLLAGIRTRGYSVKFTGENRA